MKLDLGNNAVVASDKLITFKDLKKLAGLASLPPAPVIVKDLQGKYEFSKTAITATVYSQTELQDGDYYIFTKYVLLGDFQYGKDGIYKSGTLTEWSAQELTSTDSSFDTGVKSWFYEKNESSINLTGKEAFLVGCLIQQLPHQGVDPEIADQLEQALEGGRGDR